MKKLILSLTIALCCFIVSCNKNDILTSSDIEAHEVVKMIKFQGETVALPDGLTEQSFTDYLNKSTCLCS